MHRLVFTANHEITNSLNGFVLKRRSRLIQRDLDQPGTTYR